LYKSELCEIELGDLVPVHAPEALVTGAAGRAGSKVQDGPTDAIAEAWRPRRRNCNGRSGQPDP